MLYGGMLVVDVLWVSQVVSKSGTVDMKAHAQKNRNAVMKTATKKIAEFTDFLFSIRQTIIKSEHTKNPTK